MTKTKRVTRARKKGEERGGSSSKRGGSTHWETGKERCDPNWKISQGRHMYV